MRHGLAALRNLAPSEAMQSGLLSLGWAGCNRAIDKRYRGSATDDASQIPVAAQPVIGIVRAGKCIACHLDEPVGQTFAPQ